MFAHYGEARAYHEAKMARWRRATEHRRWRQMAAPRSGEQHWHHRAAHWMGVRMVRWGTRLRRYGTTAPNLAGRL
jgi:hypothetical protein